MRAAVEVSDMAQTESERRAEEQHTVKFYEDMAKTDDLEKGACNITKTDPRIIELTRIISEAAPEIAQDDFGCGTALPLEDITGQTLLDLGCGAGKEAYIAAALAGPDGSVYGIDLSERRLSKALGAQEKIKAAFQQAGFIMAPVVFRQGTINNLSRFKNGTIDRVISNCVINLSRRKDQVFSECFRVLGESGEVYFSDNVADRRVPNHIKYDRDLVAKCIGGCEYEHALFDIMKTAGFGDPRVVSRTNFDSATLPDVVQKADLHIAALTVRAIKRTNPVFELRCEDYGQGVRYRGTDPAAKGQYVLDRPKHVFPVGKLVPVCGNTYLMIAGTQREQHFELIGPTLKQRNEWDNYHRGLFPCGPEPSNKESDAQKPCC